VAAAPRRRGAERETAKLSERVPLRALIGVGLAMALGAGTPEIGAARAGPLSPAHPTCEKPSRARTRECMETRFIETRSIPASSWIERRSILTSYLKDSPFAPTLPSILQPAPVQAGRVPPACEVRRGAPKTPAPPTCRKALTRGA
jgi:hypothetical protein